MDSSTPCANIISGDIGCETPVYNLSCEKSHREHKEGTCCNMKGTAKITPQEVLDISSVSEEDNSVVREAGTVPGAFLHASNLDGRISDPNAISDQEETLDSKEIKTCQESCDSVSLDAKKLKSLNKCATFPCSSEVQLDILPVKGSNEESSTEVHGRCSSTFKSPTYARSMSLPTSLKLVSAMKGGRAQNGTSPTMKLHVKWAPEVYDPPATSMSHTVKKSHHQRPKAKKKDSHRNKHSKGKSYRASGMERKHANHSSTGTVSNPLDMRLPVAGDRLLSDGYGKSNAEVLEYAVSTRESKCGGGFLREALAKKYACKAARLLLRGGGSCVSFSGSGHGSVRVIHDSMEALITREIGLGPFHCLPEVPLGFCRLCGTCACCADGMAERTSAIADAPPKVLMF